MIQYLEAYCDINEIYEQESLVVIWNELINNPSVSLYTFSRYWFVLNWFQSLLQEKRNIESFMTMWDISSKEKIIRDQLPHEWLEQVSVLINSTDFNWGIVVLDNTVLVGNSEDDLKRITETIENKWGKVFMIR